MVLIVGVFCKRTNVTCMHIYSIVWPKLSTQGPLRKEGKCPLQFGAGLILFITLMILGSSVYSAYGFPPRQPSERAINPEPAIAPTPVNNFVDENTTNENSILNNTLPYTFPWGSITCDLQSQNNSACFNPYALGVRQVENGQFKKISSLAILSPSPATKIPEANTTFLYVADSGNDSIEKFFINGTSVLKWGSKGTFQGQFYRPTAIAASNDSIFVADSTGRIQVFDTNGTFRTGWGSLGTLDQQFLNITGIAVSQASIPNSTAAAVQIGPAMSVSPVTNFTNNYDERIPELNRSVVYVADSENNKIQEFYPNGTFIRKFGQPGQLDGEFRNPSAIAIEPLQKFIYVADSGNNRIQVFSPNGTFANKWNLTFTNTSLTGTPLHPIRPTGLSVLQNRLLVADSDNNRILEYLLNGTFVNQWNLTGSSLSTLNLRNSNPLSISTSASNSGIGFIAIGFGAKNIAGVYLYPKGADAGKDIYTQSGTTILLNGSKSSATLPNSTILRYNWKLILPVANTSSPILPFESHDKLASFIVPALLGNATLPFELNTVDSAGYNSSDLVNVFVKQQGTTLAPFPQLLAPPSLAAVPNTTPQYDKFGVLQIYPTRAAGEEWFMDITNPMGDKRFDPGNKITRNPDGSWKMTSTQVRMGVFPSTGYNPGTITTTRELELEKKGYMQGPNDWKNVEMTGYVKFNSGSEDNFAWYARGGRHTGSGPMEGCEGVAYKGDLYFSGKTQIAKEQWHVSYDYSPAKQAIESIKGKWVGFKFIIYNTILPDGRIAVKMENWVDRNSDQHWEKIYEYVDSGGWGRDGIDCGGRADQIISWGGPIATFRWDSANDVDFKSMSVREINGQAGPSVIPPGGQIFNMSSGQGGTLPSSGSHETSGNMNGQGQEPPSKSNDQVAIFEKNVHTIWEEPVGKNLQVFYKRSLDGGNTYDKPINLSNSSQDSFDAKIRVSKTDKVGVVFRAGNDIFYTASDNNGLTFSSPINVSKSPNTISSDPNIEIVDGSDVKIVWVEHDVENMNSTNTATNSSGTSGGATKTNIPALLPNDPSIGYTLSPVSLQSFTPPAGQSKVVNVASSNKNEEHTVIDSAVVISESKNGGISFSTPRVITADREMEMHTPEIATTSNGKVYLCYVKGIEDNTDVFCNHSNDTGNTFSNSTNITGDPSSASLTPKLSASGDSVYLAWSDLKNGTGGNLDVFSMVATGDNSTFGSLTNLSNDTAGSVNPDISTSGGKLHTVWGENTPGNNAIITRSSNDSGRTFDNKIFLNNNNESLVSHPKIAASGDNIIIVTSAQNKSGNQDILVRKSNDGGESFGEEINLTENTTATSENQTSVNLVGPQMAIPGQVISFYAQTAGSSMNETATSYYFNVSGPQPVIIIVAEGNQSPTAQFKMPKSCLGAENEEYQVNVTVGDSSNSELRGLAKVVMNCISGQGFALKSSKEMANPGETITISGLISGIPKDQQQSVEIFPALSKLNVTEKSRCLDINDSRCDPPQIQFVMPQCSDSNNTRISFEGFVTDIHDKKYANSTAVLLACSGTNVTNNPPQANDSRYTTEIGTPVTIDLKQLTIDKDQDSLSATIIDKPSYGDVDDSRINSDGIIVYSPHDPSNSSSGPALPAGGEDTFTYNVFDGKQYSNKAKIMINLVPRTSQPLPPVLPAEANSENSAPVANDFSVPITSDQPIRINLLEHTTDVDGDKLVAYVVTQPQFSQMPIILENDSATVYYQQLIDVDIQRHQEDSFTYQVSDGKNTSNVATIRLIPSTMLPDELPLPNRSEVIPSEAPQSQTVQTSFAPVAHDVSGETQPGKPVEIMLDVTDEDSKDLTAILVKEPDCGSEVLNQKVGSLVYTAKSTSSISDSQCVGDLSNGWQDTITYKVSDGEHDSNVATIIVKIEPIKEPSANSSEFTNIVKPEVKLTGPGSASAGDNVTLIGNLIGINADQIAGAQFSQESGMNVSYVECVRGYLQCSYPGISFILPQCPVDDKTFRFKLSVTENLTQYDDSHTVKLNCPDN